MTNARVIVAADQVDEARAIASRPIPQEIIEESKIEIPGFNAPKRPICRAEALVLESVDPVNTRPCEICGKEWAEPAGGLT